MSAGGSTRKLRVLMAHGYTSNSFIFTKRAGAIRKACRDVADFTFINGPLLVQPITAAGDLDAPDGEDGKLITEDTPIEEQPRAWWRADDEGNYIDWDKTVNYLNDVLEKEGPFDAVWGFSQGGCLAGLLAAGFENPANMPGLKLPRDQGPLKFAIAVSGFRSRDRVHQKLFEKPIQTPVLHVLGRADQIVDIERSQTLVDVCKNSRVELHDGGHSLPSQAPWRNFFRDFLSAFCSDPYVPNDTWRKVAGPSDRPRGDTPAGSGTVTPTPEPATSAAPALAANPSSGEQDIDPSNPSRAVPKKKANQPFLKHQRWKEEQELRRRKAAPASSSRGSDQHDSLKARGSSSAIGGDSNELVDLTGPFATLATLLKYVVLTAAIAMAVGQFVSGDPIWGYRGKYIKLRTYMPYRERIFSLPELAMYNGRDPKKPVYLAILGEVYDVSAGRRMYGPGGSYAFFGGKDASRAYVTGCFETHLTYDIRDFDDKQMADLVTWKKFYENHNDYFKVGRVVLPPLDDNVPIPEPCDGAVPQK
ncbi:hypothetical protein BCV70DRAFT_176771 [Testicularia cyperi]|uniref:Cytochrome b5 heme-binding domain-containing protein n=1 Tax=Testicularia cyperi TaxID=1882483 RepID=A0A317XP40_9BASI|nr:hypothetical protein BCV70DRAFT_176771 [Testicularia cyperi]